MKKYIVGNWKMNQSVTEIRDYFSKLSTLLNTPKHHLWIAPQALHLSLVKELGTTLGVKVGAQNCSNHLNGAFTGEISPRSLKDFGIDFTLIGHSERRQLFGEANDLLNQKTQTALNEDMTVIFCVGETLQEREDNRTMEVLSNQLKQGLKDLPSNKLDRLLVAYEPVWAIGTGKTATPDQAEEAHKHIKSVLADFLGKELPVLYGGSVKPSNAKELLSKASIDGALIGGASLKADDFFQISQAI